MIYSSHTFICPFRWSIPADKNKLFSQQINLSRIEYRENSQWVRTLDDEAEREIVYDEKNYFFEFVHPILYDDGSEGSMIRHFERQELHAKMPVKYKIKHKSPDKLYVLDVAGMALNLYATGVGTLIFNLHNTSEEQNTPDDILRINQYGRRFVLPFYSDRESRVETAEYLEISGLKSEACLREDFLSIQPDQPNKPARFITELVEELTKNIEIAPIIDDRMFVVSWYINDELKTKYALKTQDSLEKDFLYGDNFWYRFVFVDGGSDPTCQNEKMYRELLEKHSYLRWQKWGTIYGITRYSMVMLIGAGAPEHLKTNMETEYTRMVELALVQRASVLRFSGEVSRISRLQEVSSKLSKKISVLYSEYIRFVNQIYFREITAQEQGIEIYEMLHESMNTRQQVEKLDDEVEELFNHVSLMEDRSSNKQMSYLSWVATLFIPISFVSSLYGMNNGWDVETFQLWWIGGVLIASIIVSSILLKIQNRKRH